MKKVIAVFVVHAKDISLLSVSFIAIDTITTTGIES